MCLFRFYKFFLSLLLVLFSLDSSSNNLLLSLGN